jgi:hypothetical protein
MGRPSKKDLEERARRKKEYEREEEHRERMESLIKERRPLSDLVREPGMKFLFGRIEGVTIGQSQAAWQRAILDLLESDLPLDKDARGRIAVEMRNLMYPTTAAKQAAIDEKVARIKQAIAVLERRGEAPADARDQIAEALDFASGESFRKWFAAHKHLFDET